MRAARPHSSGHTVRRACHCGRLLQLRRSLETLIWKTNQFFMANFDGAVVQIENIKSVSTQ